MSDSCDPMDCSPPGSSVHGILQARILDGLPLPSPGDLPDTEIEPGPAGLQADSSPSELRGKIPSCVPGTCSIEEFSLNPFGHSRIEVLVLSPFHK